MTDDREMWYRVPRSAEECAVHLEAGGVVEFNKPWDGTWRGTTTAPIDFRRDRSGSLRRYRLVYSTPVGMSPVIGAPGHAYGLAKDAPVGWPSSGHGDNTAPMNVAEDFTPYCIIEARPPAPAPEPRTEKVPLTKLVGRTIHGCNEAATAVSMFTSLMVPQHGGDLRPGEHVSSEPAPPTPRQLRPHWRWRPDTTAIWQDFPGGALDVETGLVEVLAEEEA